MSQHFFLFRNVRPHISSEVATSSPEFVFCDVFAYTKDLSNNRVPVAITDSTFVSRSDGNNANAFTVSDVGTSGEIRLDNPYNFSASDLLQYTRRVLVKYDAAFGSNVPVDRYRLQVTIGGSNYFVATESNEECELRITTAMEVNVFAVTPSGTFDRNPNSGSNPAWYHGIDAAGYEPGTQTTSDSDYALTKIFTSSGQEETDLRDVTFVRFHDELQSATGHPLGCPLLIFSVQGGYPDLAASNEDRYDVAVKEAIRGNAEDGSLTDSVSVGYLFDKDVNSEGGLYTDTRRVYFGVYIDVTKHGAANLDLFELTLVVNDRVNNHNVLLNYHVYAAPDIVVQDLPVRLSGLDRRQWKEASNSLVPLTEASDYDLTPKYNGTHRCYPVASLAWEKVNDGRLALATVPNSLRSAVPLHFDTVYTTDDTPAKTTSNYWVHATDGSSASLAGAAPYTETLYTNNYTDSLRGRAVTKDTSSLFLSSLASTYSFSVTEGSEVTRQGGWKFTNTHATDDQTLTLSSYRQSLFYPAEDPVTLQTLECAFVVVRAETAGASGSYDVNLTFSAGNIAGASLARGLNGTTLTDGQVYVFWTGASSPADIIPGCLADLPSSTTFVNLTTEVSNTNWDLKHAVIEGVDFKSTLAADDSLVLLESGFIGRAGGAWDYMRYLPESYIDDDLNTQAWSGATPQKAVVVASSTAITDTELTVTSRQDFSDTELPSSLQYCLRYIQYGASSGAFTEVSAARVRAFDMTSLDHSRVRIYQEPLAVMTAKDRTAANSQLDVSLLQGDTLEIAACSLHGGIDTPSAPGDIVSTTPQWVTVDIAASPAPTYTGILTDRTANANFTGDIGSGMLSYTGEMPVDAASADGHGWYFVNPGARVGPNASAWNRANNAIAWRLFSAVNTNDDEDFGRAWSDFQTTWCVFKTHSTRSLPHLRVRTFPASSSDITDNGWDSNVDSAYRAQALYAPDVPNDLAANEIVGLYLGTEPDWVALFGAEAARHIRPVGMTIVDVGETSDSLGESEYPGDDDATFTQTKVMSIEVVTADDKKAREVECTFYEHGFTYGSGTGGTYTDGTDSVTYADLPQRYRLANNGQSPGDTFAMKANVAPDQANVNGMVDIAKASVSFNQVLDAATVTESTSYTNYGTSDPLAMIYNGADGAAPSATIEGIDGSGWGFRSTGSSSEQLVIYTYKAYSNTANASRKFSQFNTMFALLKLRSVAHLPFFRVEDFNTNIRDYVIPTNHSMSDGDFVLMYIGEEQDWDSMFGRELLRRTHVQRLVAGSTFDSIAQNAPISNVSLETGDSMARDACDFVLYEAGFHWASPENTGTVTIDESAVTIVKPAGLYRMRAVASDPGGNDPAILVPMDVTAGTQVIAVRPDRLVSEGTLNGGALSYDTSTVTFSGASNTPSINIANWRRGANFLDYDTDEASGMQLTANLRFVDQTLNVLYQIVPHADSAKPEVDSAVTSADGTGFTVETYRTNKGFFALDITGDIGSKYLVIALRLGSEAYCLKLDGSSVERKIAALNGSGSGTVENKTGETYGSGYFTFVGSNGAGYTTYNVNSDTHTIEFLPRFFLEMLHGAAPQDLQWDIHHLDVDSDNATFTWKNADAKTPLFPRTTNAAQTLEIYRAFESSATGTVDAGTVVSQYPVLVQLKRSGDNYAQTGLNLLSATRQIVPVSALTTTEVSTGAGVEFHELQGDKAGLDVTSTDAFSGSARDDMIQGGYDVSFSSPTFSRVGSTRGDDTTVSNALDFSTTAFARGWNFIPTGIDSAIVSDDDLQSYIGQWGKFTTPCTANYADDVTGDDVTMDLTVVNGVSAYEVPRWWIHRNPNAVYGPVSGATMSSTVTTQDSEDLQQWERLVPTDGSYSGSPLLTTNNMDYVLVPLESFRDTTTDLVHFYTECRYVGGVQGWATSSDTDVWGTSDNETSDTHRWPIQFDLENVEYVKDAFGSNIAPGTYVDLSNDMAIDVENIGDVNQAEFTIRFRTLVSRENFNTVVPGATYHITSSVPGLGSSFAAEMAVDAGETATGTFGELWSQQTRKIYFQFTTSEIGSTDETNTTFCSPSQVLVNVKRDADPDYMVQRAEEPQTFVDAEFRGGNSDNTTVLAVVNSTLRNAVKLDTLTFPSGSPIDATFVTKESNANSSLLRFEDKITQDVIMTFLPRRLKFEYNRNSDFDPNDYIANVLNQTIGYVVEDDMANDIVTIELFENTLAPGLGDQLISPNVRVLKVDDIVGVAPGHVVTDINDNVWGTVIRAYGSSPTYSVSVSVTNAVNEPPYSGSGSAKINGVSKTMVAATENHNLFSVAETPTALDLTRLQRERFIDFQKSLNGLLVAQRTKTITLDSLTSIAVNDIVTNTSDEVWGTVTAIDTDNSQVTVTITNTSNKPTYVDASTNDIKIAGNDYNLQAAITDPIQYFRVQLDLPADSMDSAWIDNTIDAGGSEWGTVKHIAGNFLVVQETDSAQRPSFSGLGNSNTEATLTDGSTTATANIVERPMQAGILMYGNTRRILMVDQTYNDASAQLAYEEPSQRYRLLFGTTSAASLRTIQLRSLADVAAINLTWSANETTDVLSQWSAPDAGFLQLTELVLNQEPASGEAKNEDDTVIDGINYSTEDPLPITAHNGKLRIRRNGRYVLYLTNDDVTDSTDFRKFDTTSLASGGDSGVTVYRLVENSGADDGNSKYRLTTDTATLTALGAEGGSTISVVCQVLRNGWKPANGDLLGVLDAGTSTYIDRIFKVATSSGVVDCTQRNILLDFVLQYREKDGLASSAEPTGLNSEWGTDFIRFDNLTFDRVNDIMDDLPIFERICASDDYGSSSTYARAIEWRAAAANALSNEVAFGNDQDRYLKLELNNTTDLTAGMALYGVDPNVSSSAQAIAYVEDINTTPEPDEVYIVLIRASTDAVEVDDLLYADNNGTTLTKTVTKVTELGGSSTKKFYTATLVPQTQTITVSLNGGAYDDWDTGADVYNGSDGSKHLGKTTSNSINSGTASGDIVVSFRSPGVTLAPGDIIHVKSDPISAATVTAVSYPVLNALANKDLTIDGTAYGTMIAHSDSMGALIGPNGSGTNPNLQPWTDLNTLPVRYTVDGEAFNVVATNMSLLALRSGTSIVTSDGNAENIGSNFKVLVPSSKSWTLNASVRLYDSDAMNYAETSTGIVTNVETAPVVSGYDLVTVRTFGSSTAMLSGQQYAIAVGDTIDDDTRGEVMVVQSMRVLKTTNIAPGNSLADNSDNTNSVAHVLQVSPYNGLYDTVLYYRTGDAAGDPLTPEASEGDHLLSTSGTYVKLNENTTFSPTVVISRFALPLGLTTPSRMYQSSPGLILDRGSDWAANITAFVHGDKVREVYTDYEASSIEDRHVYKYTMSKHNMTFTLNGRTPAIFLPEEFTPRTSSAGLTHGVNASVILGSTVIKERAGNNAAANDMTVL